MLRDFYQNIFCEKSERKLAHKTFFFKSEDKLSLPTVAKWILIIYICSVDGSELKTVLLKAKAFKHYFLSNEVSSFFRYFIFGLKFYFAINRLQSALDSKFNTIFKQIKN